MNYIYSKIKQYRSVLNIVAICCFCVILLIFAFSSCNASKAADVSTGSSAEETTSVTITESGSETEETNSEESTTVLIDTPITFNDMQYVELYNIEETEKKLEELAVCINQLTEAIDSGLYEFPARYTMQLENNRLLLIEASYQANLEALKAWENEYYYAYRTLDFFMQNGYSREVACGIIGNMMVEDGKIVIIDFDRYDFGDPWEEFNRIVWCAQAAPSFASGNVDGYFGGKVPRDFWSLLALYIASNTLSSLYWAIPFGEKEINTMRNQAREVLDWYDNFTNVIPKWYKGGKNG